MNPGIHFDVPNEAYHSHTEAIGASGLKDMLVAPAHYYGQNLDPNRPAESGYESPGRKFGNLAHCALFEPEKFNQRYRVGPDVHNKNVKAWQDFKKQCEVDGCLPIDSAENECATMIRQSALSNPEVARAFSKGHGEVSAVWRDESTGALCKCRPDWVYEPREDAVILIDGKTFNTAGADEFARQAGRMRYALQAAWYSDGYQIASGKRVLAFLFLAVADTYPYLCNLIQLDDEAMSAGRRQYRQALDLYAKCKAGNEWPGHGDDIKLVSLRSWELE